MKHILKIKSNKVICFIKKCVTEIYEKRITAYAAQASFFVIISSIPFIMLLVSLIQLFIPIQKQELLNLAHNYLPSQIYNFGKVLITEIFSHVSVSIISLTALALLWSASSGVASIGQGLKSVYGSPKNKGFILNSLFSLLYTLIFMAIMIACVSILVFGESLATTITKKISSLTPIIDGLLELRSVIFLVFLSFMFMLAYKHLAKNTLPFKAQFPGAAFAALGWLLFSYVYSLYIANFTSFSYVYGSLTAIILLMLWLYMCMIILLVGAQINVWIFNNEYTFNKLYKHIYVKKKIKK